MYEFNNAPDQTKEKIQWNRNDVTATVVNFELAKQKQSQRQFAKAQGVPRTTLQHWLARKDSIDASPNLIWFFESPKGTAFFHRMITAAHFEFTKHGVASIHNVSNFLNLCGVSPFIASSYLTQRRASNNMDKVIFEFDKSEGKRLSKNMLVKKILPPLQSENR